MFYYGFRLAIRREKGEKGTRTLDENKRKNVDV